jgi:hypothetical protein
VSAYVSADLQRDVRARFANSCAYCRTAENLSVAVFEFEHSKCWPLMRKPTMVQLRAKKRFACTISVSFQPSPGTPALHY